MTVNSWDNDSVKNLEKGQIKVRGKREYQNNNTTNSNNNNNNRERNLKNKKKDKNNVWVVFNIKN